MVLMCLPLPLSGCQTAQANTQTDWTTEQMVTAICDSQNTQVEMTMICPQDELYETWLTTNYGLSLEDIQDGAILTVTGASAMEIAVLHLTDPSSVDLISESLENYLEDRTGAFIGYLPDEVAILEEARVVSHGDYVALLVCEDVAAAQDAFAQCFTTQPPQTSDTVTEKDGTETAESPSSLAADGSDTEMQDSIQLEQDEPPENDNDIQPDNTVPHSESEDAQIVSNKGLTPELNETDAESKEEQDEISEALWSYNRSRLVDAWNAGDWSGLCPEDQAILNTCQEVISTVVPVNGSEYEQELAVHDWMIAWGSYDSNTLSNLPDFQENPNNDNPYGFLIDRKGICLGYTSTFQLFMDLLGIECISVSGSAYNGTSDHAWNQVCLDGEWYCVDVTWDDPTTSGSVSERMAHRYFNVTSSHMRDTDHQWDESMVPEASGTAHSWN